MNSLRGQLLIARPELHDENFFRSVVLLVQHDDEITLGLALNRPSGVSVRRVWRQLTEADVRCEAPIFVGGPVGGPLMLLHAAPDFTEIEVLAGVSFTSEREHLHAVIEGDRQPFRLFNGYAGWSPGQLEAEMAEGAWITLPAQRDYVFEVPPEDLWKTVTAAWGEGVISGLGIRERPAEPWLN